jgi:hypothetical protein
MAINLAGARLVTHGDEELNAKKAESGKGLR